MYERNWNLGCEIASLWYGWHSISPLVGLKGFQSIHWSSESVWGVGGSAQRGIPIIIQLYTGTVLDSGSCLLIAGSKAFLGTSFGQPLHIPLWRDFVWDHVSYDCYTPSDDFFEHQKRWGRMIQLLNSL